MYMEYIIINSTYKKHTGLDGSKNEIFQAIKTDFMFCAKP